MCIHSITAYQVFLKFKEHLNFILFSKIPNWVEFFEHVEANKMRIADLCYAGILARCFISYTLREGNASTDELSKVRVNDLYGPIILRQYPPPQLTHLQDRDEGVLLCPVTFFFFSFLFLYTKKIKFSMWWSTGARNGPGGRY